ncbi:hypothetical protein AYL99_11770 [Fonsecaea erecta]|uniref:Uncharacterized protein n=1 Tax=Fonsecaea erecta TaxID=1367422 RepID=A0A178Z2L8_9EURO|nr:hypothetical protein AYL99_11770 [Fonsecaea erecta]OAP54010.1 hypothetical protein AYL99_11770 [Fonsecaea erecta]
MARTRQEVPDVVPKLLDNTKRPLEIIFDSRVSAASTILYDQALQCVESHIAPKLLRRRLIAIFNSRIPSRAASNTDTWKENKDDARYATIRQLPPVVLLWWAKSFNSMNWRARSMSIDTFNDLVDKMRTQSLVVADWQYEDLVAFAQDYPLASSPEYHNFIRGEKKNSFHTTGQSKGNISDVGAWISPDLRPIPGGLAFPLPANYSYWPVQVDSDLPVPFPANNDYVETWPGQVVSDQLSGRASSLPVPDPQVLAAWNNINDSPGFIDPDYMNNVPLLPFLTPWGLDSPYATESQRQIYREQVFRASLT